MRELPDKKYSLSEVKELLREQSFEYETALSDQKERLFALLTENEKQKAEIAEYKANKDAVSNALVLAMNKANEIEKLAKQRFETNLIRLKVFDSKMVAYYKRIIAKYPLDENLIKTEEFLKKLDEILSTDYMNSPSPDKMFKSNNPTFSYGGKVMFNEISPNESGFDINEALNPNKDLEEICKELGLMP